MSSCSFPFVMPCDYFAALCDYLKYEHSLTIRAKNYLSLSR